MSEAKTDVLVERLRACEAGGMREQTYQSICGDAADTINSLRAKLAEAEERAAGLEQLGYQHADRIAAAEAALARARKALEAIIVRCEEGDKKSDWLPTIADIARRARQEEPKP